MVGPRPDVPKYVATYTGAQRRVLALTPGITDRASSKFLDEARFAARAVCPGKFYIDRIMPEKSGSIWTMQKVRRAGDLMVITTPSDAYCLVSVCASEPRRISTRRDHRAIG